MTRETPRRTPRRRVRWLPTEFVKAAWSTPGVTWRYVVARLVEVGMTVLALAAGVQLAFVVFLWTHPVSSLDPDRTWTTGVFVAELTVLFVLRAIAATTAAGWLPGDREPIEGEARFDRLFSRGGFDHVSRTPVGRMLKKGFTGGGSKLVAVIFLLLILGGCAAVASAPGARLLVLALFLVLLGAGLVTVLLWLGYGTLWFGTTSVEFVGAPFAPGESVKVLFHAHGDGTIFRELDMTLVAGHVRRGWLGDVKLTRSEPLHRVLPDAPVFPPEPAGSIEVTFSLPPDAAVPSVDPLQVTYWSLEISGTTNGSRYEERFLLPVVGRQVSAS